MPTTPTTEDLRTAQRAVLRTLAYFDIFGHPLTTEELSRFGDSAAVDALKDPGVLRSLQTMGLVMHYDGYWSLGDTRTAVEQRRIAEARAEGRWPKALRMSRLIGRFPYVRAVFISGSMSKGRLDADGDIDYFLVTAPGRLWIARTLLILYKKVILLNSRRDFCVNYFVDTDHLAIEDRNRFTATEIVTLVPTYGNGTTEAFFERNAWAFGAFPGLNAPRSHEVSIGRARMKRLLERSMRGAMGDMLDEWCMKLTWHFWKRKFGTMDARTFDLAMRTRTYVSKHHPSNFQQRVLDSLQQRMSDLERALDAPLR